MGNGINKHSFEIKAIKKPIIISNQYLENDNEKDVVEDLCHADKTEAIEEDKICSTNDNALLSPIPLNNQTYNSSQLNSSNGIRSDISNNGFNHYNKSYQEKYVDLEIDNTIYRVNSENYLELYFKSVSNR